MNTRHTPDSPLLQKAWLHFGRFFKKGPEHRKSAKCQRFRSAESCTSTRVADSWHNCLNHAKLDHVGDGEFAEHATTVSVFRLWKGVYLQDGRQEGWRQAHHV